MELFLCMLADIFHSAAIFVMCGMLFSFRSRDYKYKNFIWLFCGLILCTASIVIYLCNNDIFELLIYIISVISLIYMLYKERIYKVIVVAMWSIFVVSVIDIMTMVLVNISAQLLHIDLGIADRLIESLFSCCIIYTLGRLYKSNVSKTLLYIGSANLVGFSVLLVADLLVVSAIAAGADIYEGSRKNLYLIAVVFIIIGIFIQLVAVIILFAQRNVHKEKERILAAYLNEQKNHYEYLENREKETKKFRHDLRNHMEIISNLAQNQECEKIDEYLEQMNIKIETFGNVVTVHNGMVDAIVNQYYMKAKQNGVNLKVEGKFPVDCGIDAYDLCTIFSNVLSNAYEAAVETEEKKISLVCGYTERNIIIAVENSCRNKDGSGGLPWKTKKGNTDYHGYGLENIMDSVKKYDGIFDIEMKDNMCMLKILFNHKNESEVEELE